MSGIYRNGKSKPAERGRKVNGSYVARLSKGENVRRAFDLVVIGVVQAALCAGIASAGVLDFTDNFDSFDETRWTKGDHNLGRSYLDPNNVSVSGGNL